jgi:hypothetical protein
LRRRSPGDIASAFRWSARSAALVLADYALATLSRAADWPIDLYVRQDEIGLRRPLPEPAERPAR